MGSTERCGTAQFSPGFLLPQGSHPASGDLKPSFPVEAFLSRSHMEVEGFLEWQLTQAFGLVHTVTSSGEQAGIVHHVILTSEHLVLVFTYTIANCPRSCSCH